MKLRNADEIKAQFWGGGFDAVKAREGRLVVLKNRRAPHKKHIQDTAHSLASPIDTRDITYSS